MSLTAAAVAGVGTGLVSGAPDPLIQRAGDLLISLGRRVLVDHRGPYAVMPMRAFKSARLTPACAARVFPVCRRS